MEKLIELLNEYEAERHKTNVIPQIRKGEDRLSYLEMNWSYSELLCISKRYGFIKWLVENDKIDRDKNVLAFKFSSVYTYDGEDYEDYLKECKLLMLLAIQDEPIRFLCEILK